MKNLLLLSFLLKSSLGVGQSYDAMAGFLPGSDVTQHSRIDLDQRDFQYFLKMGDFNKASDIYINGGNSMKTTKLTLATSMTKQYPKFTAIKQGKAEGTLSTAAKIGDNVLKVGVTSSCVGPLAQFPDQSGCFNEEDPLTINGEEIESGWGVNVNTPYRTLSGFSVQAESKMKGQRMFEMYKKYYGTGDYADKFIKAALLGNDETKRISPKVPFKFLGKDDIYRVECAQKGSAYWALWMYVIREMEDGVNDCEDKCPTNSCNDAPVHAWDEAAAFYIGSLEGKYGRSPDGTLLYSLAEKRCQNFGTCECNGLSACTNERVLGKFAEGKRLLEQGKCQEVVAVKDRIVSLMTIPLVQGTLRYAYKINFEEVGPKEIAEGVAFAGAILPQLAACGDGKAAEEVAKYMWIDAEFDKETVDMWNIVKAQLEASYDCLGITRNDVGGLIQSQRGFSSSDSASNKIQTGISMFLTSVIILLA